MLIKAIEPINPHCKCGVKLARRLDGTWMHQITLYNTSCGTNGDPDVPTYTYSQDVPDQLRGYSKNTLEYYELWRKTLHQNCRGTECTCHIGATNLALERVAFIRRGMPDLPHAEESAVWSLAFKIHDRHLRGGPITPTWSKDKKGCCDCFEKAMKELAMDLDSKPGIPRIQINPDDVWYDEQRIE